MKQLKENPLEALNPLPVRGQIGFLSSSKMSFSGDTLAILGELGNVLSGIHKRMLSEGFELVDGTIRKSTS